MAQGNIIFADLLFWLSLCLAPTGSQAVLWLQPHQVPRTRCQRVPSMQDRSQGAGQTHAISGVQNSAAPAAPLGAFCAAAPCLLGTKGHQGQLSCSGSATCFPLQPLGMRPEGRSPRLLAAPAVRQLSWDVPLFPGGSWLCGVASSRVPSWCQLKLPLHGQGLCAPQSLPWLPAGGAVRGVILKSLWVGKSLDFISPF